MISYSVHLGRGTYVCHQCLREFPTHYRLRDPQRRAQLGRRYVSGFANFLRHVEVCSKCQQAGPAPSEHEQVERSEAE